ncbi:MAG: GNAT family N-acetyltransferase [Myxococcota bacterium]
MRAGEEGSVLDLLEVAFGFRERFRTYLELDPELGPDDTLLALRDGRPVSCLQIFTKRVRLRGAEVSMGGIGSVATHPDHRGSNLATALLESAIEEMQARNMVLSLLFSTVRPLYEPLGWVSVPQTRRVLHPKTDVAWPDGSRRYRDLDRPQIEFLYERYSARIDGTTLRDSRYWDGQLGYAGNPDELFLVVERAGEIRAYARRVEFENVRVAIEYGRAVGARTELAALLAAMAENRALVLPAAPDPGLETALGLHARRLDRIEDPSIMWRVLDRERVRSLAAGLARPKDPELLERLLGGDRALYWPSDRF